MEKVIDPDRTVFALCSDYPELVRIMLELGFTDITKPGMLFTVGRFMTLRKGTAYKKIDPEALRAALLRNGYIIKENESHE